MQTSLIIGAGEIGKSLHKVIGGEIRDKEYVQGHYDIIHICFPYDSAFISEVEIYQNQHTPKYTVIHSTVPVGTSRKCNAIHSPCLGVHPYLEESFKTFTKYLGGENAGEVADYFRRANIKVYITDLSETTELMKLLCTTKYGVDIEYVKDVKKQCDKYGVPFEMWTLWTDNYNQGYKKLWQEQFTRPNLIPNMQKINGHCVMPNTELIDTPFTKILKELNG
ncbi:hypothetical protein M0R04_13045 [Candidatus Dojkabacteria bacterium]|jgi:hypothetical protein|nr:hypothetical protein [Candidatus Dojkabacteria bacterium]